MNAIRALKEINSQLSIEYIDVSNIVENIDYMYFGIPKVICIGCLKSYTYSSTMQFFIICRANSTASINLAKRAIKLFRKHNVFLSNKLSNLFLSKLKTFRFNDEVVIWLSNKPNSYISASIYGFLK